MNNTATPAAATAQKSAAANNSALPARAKVVPALPTNLSMYFGNLAMPFQIAVQALEHRSH